MATASKIPCLLLLTVLIIPAALPGLRGQPTATTANTTDAPKKKMSPEVRAQRMADRIFMFADTNGDGELDPGEMAVAKGMPGLERLSLTENGTVTKAALVDFLKDGVMVPNDAQKDIVYKQVGEWRGLFDLYPPLARTYAKAPVLVFFHGGGWKGGNKNRLPQLMTGPIAQRLRENGFAAVSVAYRLSTADNTNTVNDCVVDCKDALRYLRKNADALGLDMDRCVVFGESAGAHLAMMMTLAPDDVFAGDPELSSYHVKPLACVSWFGPTTFTDKEVWGGDEDYLRKRVGSRFFGPDTPPGQEQEILRRVSPIVYLQKDSPPVLLFQGDQDKVVPLENALRLQQNATQIGARVEVAIVKNAGHIWMRDGPDPISPSIKELEQQTGDFLLAAVQKSGPVKTASVGE